MASQSSQTSETRPIAFKSFKVKVKILKATSSLSKIVRDRPILRSYQSPLKTLVHNLIFKTGPFMPSHLYKTLFGHLLTHNSKQRKSRARKAKKEKDNMYGNNKEMFINTEYSLQLQIVHHYYSRVQDTTLQIDTRAIYILRWSMLQEMSSSRSGRPAKRGHISCIRLVALT